MGATRRNGLWIYDVPLWKDWLVYLTVAAVAIGLAQPDSLATPVDALIAVAVQVALFGVVPGVVRKRGRERRHERGWD